MNVRNGLEILLKGAVEGYFSILFQFLPKGSEGQQGKYQIKWPVLRPRYKP
jgi:hypothetical protein